MDAEVIVVGAGLSGTTCAAELARAGRDVLLLEARDRVGGRTYTKTFDGMTFDLGGQWLGPTQNRMYALCRSLGIETFPTHCVGTKFLDDGKKARPYSGKIPKVSPLHLAEVQLAMMKLERRARDLPTDPRDAAHYDGETVATWRGRMIYTEKSRALFDVAVRSVFGCEPAEMSALWFLHYLRTGGGFARHIDTDDGAQQDRIVGGAQQISLRLAEGLGDRLRLEHPVREVNQDAGGVAVRTDRGTLTARRCVMALAPALLARITFNPAMPGARDLLWQRMPMGATVKLVARFERAFWRERGMSGEYVSTDGPASMVVDNTSRDGLYPALLAFVVGKHAYGWSQRNRDERRRAVLGQMARAFGDACLRPVDVIEQDWAEEHWTRGCPVGNALPYGMTTYGASLAAAVGAIHWAGAETADEWTGYMEGAVQSGERAALEVLAALA